MTRAVNRSMTQSPADFNISFTAPATLLMKESEAANIPAVVEATTVVLEALSATPSIVRPAPLSLVLPIGAEDDAEDEVVADAFARAAIRCCCS